jgi:hypothetical protein
LGESKAFPDPSSLAFPEESPLMLETIAEPAKPITALANAMFAVAWRSAAPATVAIAAILMKDKIAHGLLLEIEN